ncbi:hypothetical protein Q7C36_010566 [Tachysurus vachellii]|uniref:Uncharacterized protein n=1 Tax=Tachysurus vachellii TaxID=175792 RepID=A0AA88MUX5_TACVA|nr:hypothetical protein Q7C36_010566 [Tachysurus vachellii]
MLGPRLLGHRAGNVLSGSGDRCIFVEVILCRGLCMETVPEGLQVTQVLYDSSSLSDRLVCGALAALTLAPAELAAISTRSLLNCDKKFNTLEQVIILPQSLSSQQRQTE